MYRDRLSFHLRQSLMEESASGATQTLEASSKLNNLAENLQSLVDNAKAS